MSQGNTKRAVKKALLNSVSRVKEIRSLPAEEQAEAHKKLMRDIAGDLGVTDEKTLQLLEEHAVKEFRRKLD